MLDYATSFAQLDGVNSARIDVRTVNEARFQRVTKVGREPLTITDLTSSRDHSILNDAGRRWAAQRSALESFQADEQGKLIGNLKDPSGRNRTGPFSSRSNTLYNPTSSMDTRESSAIDAEIQTQLDAQFYANASQVEFDKKSALVISATVSAPTPITGAYGVAIARVRLNGELNDLILFSDLEPLGPEPRQIRIRKENLPLDLQVQTVDLHLFREGHELVSNRSPHQFPLTREEAIDYVVLAHTTANRGTTRPAEPNWTLPPAALWAADSPEWFDFPVRVSVDAQGRVTAILQSPLVPDHVQAAIHACLFLPALAKGVAIPAETTLNLRDFFR